jgi:NADH-quinone oxidoreductase subunit J
VFLAAALGALGMAIALPRRKVNPQPIGALLCVIAAGAVVVGLSFAAFDQGQLPNVYFYIFAAIALGAALRVVTHQRPVYAALYFILTIIASAGLFLILSAEFMAFALIIIYAGAILITYLFVLMLATQAPVEEEADRLADYDASSREPIVAAALGFLLLAVLTTMLFRGVSTLDPKGDIRSDARLMAALPVKTEERLRDAGVLGADERLQRFDVTAGDDARGTLEMIETPTGAVFFTEA